MGCQAEAKAGQLRVPRDRVVATLLYLFPVFYMARVLGFGCSEMKPSLLLTWLSDLVIANDKSPCVIFHLLVGNADPVT